MIPPGLKTLVDAEINAVAIQLPSLQDSYLNEKGRYFQCLLSPSTVPGDGGEQPHNPTVRPPHQLRDWDGVGITLPANAKASMRIDTYNGPEGRGYCIVAQVKVGVKTYIKCINTGPEVYRNQAWAEIPEQ